MTTSFPTGLDALTNPTGSSSLTSPDHAGQHTDANDAIEALQAKVGVNGSAVTTSLDYKVNNINANNITSGTLPDARLSFSGTGVSTGDVRIEMGGARTGSGHCYIDMHATSGTDFESRILRLAGANGDYSFTNTGTGTMSFEQGTNAPINFKTSSVSRMYVDTNGRVGVGTTTPMYPLDVNGTVEATQFLQGTDYLSPYQGFRNKIINGSFEFWQRGTARTFMQAGQYLADRWTVRQYQQNAHQRTVVTPVAGMQTRYALRSSSSTTAEVSGGTRMWTNTALESGDSIPLRSKTMTLSFWVRFSSATCSSSTATPYGNWYGGMQWNTSTTDASMGTNGADGASSLTLTNGSFPTTWTKYTVTGTIPSNANNVGIQFGFDGLGSTASANTVWYEITQVQLEVGSVATPFEQRPMQTELALCQRYFEKSYALNTFAGNVTATGIVQVYGSLDFALYLNSCIRFNVPKRYASYTMTGYSFTTGNVGKWRGLYNGGSSGTEQNVTFDLQTEFSFRVGVPCVGGASGGTGLIDGHWICNAEL